jgi:general secretion pathway protein J
MIRTVNPAEDGFTLVEMLVALVIFAMLSAAGVGILRSSIMTQTAVESKLTQIGGIGRLHSVLASDLGQLANRPTRGPSGDRPGFAGNEAGMNFVRAGWTNIDGQPRSDLQRVQWRFSAGALTRSGFRHVDGGDEGSVAAAFARGLGGARLRYRLPDGSWSGSFSSTEQAPFPAAVEVTLTPLAGAPVVMVFAVPHATVPA